MALRRAYWVNDAEARLEGVVYAVGYKRQIDHIPTNPGEKTYFTNIEGTTKRPHPGEYPSGQHGRRMKGLAAKVQSPHFSLHQLPEVDVARQRRAQVVAVHQQN